MGGDGLDCVPWEWGLERHTPRYGVVLALGLSAATMSRICGFLVTLGGISCKHIMQLEGSNGLLDTTKSRCTWSVPTAFAVGPL